MTSAARRFPARTHRDENFPVASWLVGADQRGRSWPSIASRAPPTTSPTTRAAPDTSSRCSTVSATRCPGRGRRRSGSRAFAAALAERGLSPATPRSARGVSPRRAQEPLRDWAELMDYCRLSAAPVGRFVLDVHGEEPATGRPPTPLCAALQVINHLQDCAEDYRRLDRVYLPQDTLAAHGASVEMLAAPTRRRPCSAPSPSSPAGRCELAGPRPRRSPADRDVRLALEIAAIQALARASRPRSRERDPLERARPSRQGGFARRRRRSASCVSLASAADAPRARRGRAEGDRMSSQARAGGAAVLLLCRDAHPAEAPAEGDVRHLRVLPRGRRHRRRARAATRRSAWRSSSAGAPTSTRCSPAARRAARRSRRGRAPLRPAAGRTSTPSSTAWRWTPPATSARRTGRRSISIATGSRAPSGGCRCASSACPPSPATRSPIISAARCS